MDIPKVHRLLVKGRNPKDPEKNPWKEDKNHLQNSTHLWCQVQESNPPTAVEGKHSPSTAPPPLPLSTLYLLLTAFLKVFLGWETSWKVTNKSLHVNNNLLTIMGRRWDYLVNLHIRWIIKMFDLGISYQAAFILSRTGKMRVMSRAMSPFTCKSFSRIPSDFEWWKEVLQAKNLTVYP